MYITIWNYENCSVNYKFRIVIFECFSLSLSQMSKQTPKKLWDFNGNLLNNVGFIFELVFFQFLTIHSLKYIFQQQVVVFFYVVVLLSTLSSLFLACQARKHIEMKFIISLFFLFYYEMNEWKIQNLDYYSKFNFLPFYI